MYIYKLIKNDYSGYLEYGQVVFVAKLNLDKIVNSAVKTYLFF